MEFFRNRDNMNLPVGIFLLIMLAVFAGQGTIGGLLGRYVPGIDEAPPCSWLRTAQDRAKHQSLIGRTAAQNGDPIQLSVRTTAAPATQDGMLVVFVQIRNRSLGTVPIIYDPDSVLIGDNNTTGLGITFIPASNIPTAALNRQDATSYPLERIRLLGPRQRCVHRVEIPFNLLTGNITSGQSSVQAYYRGNNVGQVTQLDPQATPIYNTQGLWQGLSQSATVPIPAAGT